METVLSATPNQGYMFGYVFPVSAGNNNDYNEQKLWGAMWFGFKSVLQMLQVVFQIQTLVSLWWSGSQKKTWLH